MVEISITLVHLKYFFFVKLVWKIERFLFVFFLRPVPQKPEYSCLGVCKGGKMSYHSVVNGGSTSLYVPEIQNSKVVFNTKIEGGRKKWS